MQFPGDGASLNFAVGEELPPCWQCTWWKPAPCAPHGDDGYCLWWHILREAEKTPLHDYCFEIDQDIACACCQDCADQTSEEVVTVH